MDRRAHEENLAKIASPAVQAIYETLVDQLGAGLLTPKPHRHGFLRTLRFSRGRWNPIDFIPNSTDLLCYLRAPLFTQHPYLWSKAKTVFPEGVAKGKDWAFAVEDRETCARLLRFVNEDLRNIIESHPT